ncbi:MAG: hypothetical protein L0Z50_28340 [Verrucomicrobiales bacterium]|nr:hypothetical protein [Verrucomicrobiales bacterium]
MSNLVFPNVAGGAAQHLTLPALGIQNAPRRHSPSYDGHADGYDAIETHLYFELKSGLNSIDCIQRELRHWKKGLQRKALRAVQRESTLWHATPYPD